MEEGEGQVDELRSAPSPHYRGWENGIGETRLTKKLRRGRKALCLATHSDTQRAPARGRFLENPSLFEPGSLLPCLL